MLYLREIRRRLLLLCGAYGCLFVLFFYWQDHVLHLLLKPLLEVLPKQDFMVATAVASPVLAPFHVASEAAFFVCLPLLLIQFWQFLRSALHEHERRLFMGVAIGGVVLFLSGIVFCFYGVLPFMFRLFSSMTPSHVHYFPELSAVVTFSLEMLILFGLAFQLPLVGIVLVCSNAMRYETLQQMRPYVIVTAFVLGMLLTPPDVLSQIIVAMPLWLLYEFGMLVLYFEQIRRRR